jgi:hypothetical protein
MTDSDDDVLGKADALLGRHRPQAPPRRPEPPVDFPVLTDVYSRPLPSPASIAPHDLGEEPSQMLSDTQLAQIERDLRLQLLELMGPELERLVEARVHSRISPILATVIERIRGELETEIRRAVQEALTQVVEEEIGRLQRESGSA